MPVYYFPGEKTYFKNGEPISKEIWMLEAYPEGDNPPPRFEYIMRVDAVPIMADSKEQASEIYERDYAHLYYPQS